MEIDNETLYGGVRDGIINILSTEFRQQQIERGYAWIYDAIKEGTREAIAEAIEKGKLKL